MKEALTKNSLLIAVIGVIVVSMILIAQQSEAGVDWGNEYNARLLSSTNASGTALTVLKTGYGSVGSVVVSSSSPALLTYPSLVIYDATSTMSTSTARRIGQFGSASANGTYTFDAVVTYGVAVEVPVGFAGAYTITYR